jgi:hypothetical protein
VSDPEALVVVDIRLTDDEGSGLVGGVLVVLEDGRPLPLPSDEVSCGEDKALQKKYISVSRLEKQPDIERISAGRARYMYQKKGKQAINLHGGRGGYPVGGRTGARHSHVHSCCGLWALLGCSGRCVDRITKGRTVVDVDATRARYIDRRVSDCTSTFHTIRKKGFSGQLQVGPAIAVVRSKGLRRKTARVVVYASDSIADEVFKTATYEARAVREAILCTGLLRGEDVEAEDRLHEGVLGDGKGEVEEESTEESLRRSILEIHCSLQLPRKGKKDTEDV